MNENLLIDLNENTNKLDSTDNQTHENKNVEKIQTTHTFNSGSSITHAHSTTSAPTRSEQTTKTST